jgi:hypothetical protein
MLNFGSLNVVLWPDTDSLTNGRRHFSFFPLQTNFQAVMPIWQFVKLDNALKCA